MKFTDKYIANLKPQDKMYQIREGDGFGVRVLPSGLRIFIFIYTLAGKRRQMNLGDYPDISLADARGRLVDVRKAFKDGKDPQDVGFEWHRNPVRDRLEREKKEEEDRRNPTVTELFNDYMTREGRLKKRATTCVDNERMYRVDIEPFWGKRKAVDIKKKDCIALLDRYADRPALCNNVMKLIRRVFNFAVEKDILEHTPFTGVKVPVKVFARERVLTETEIRKLWTTELPKAAMSEQVKRIIKFLLLTGQRVGEVCGISIDEVDGRWWTLPAERTKNNQTHRIYLTDTALKLLGTPYSKYFFASPVTKLDAQGNTIFNHIDENAVAYAIRKNLKNYKPRRPLKGEKISMVEVPEERKMDLAQFTPHDLRRTFSTMLAQLGFSDEVIDATTNHKKQGIIKVYNRHKYDEEKKQAFIAWEDKLSIIVKIV